MYSRFPRVLFIAFSLLAILVCLSTYSSLLSFKQQPDLHLAKDNTFHIAIFSDLHHGENEDSFGIDQDTKSTALMRDVLSHEVPNLVILNGDLITGENTFAFNSTRYLDTIVRPLVEGGYSWASTYGNHDSKYNLSREALFAKEQTYRNSYTQHGPPGSTDGVTNYVLPIYPHSTTPKIALQKKSKPVALLWFFDSRGGSAYQSHPANIDNIPNHVSNETVKWFLSTHAVLQTPKKSLHGPLPSLAFVHIPPPPYLTLQSHSHPPLVSGPNYPGLNADVPLAHQGYSPTGHEALPFTQALRSTPGLHSVYSGHDHGDSWCGRWPEEEGGEGGGQVNGGKGPFLCFCKHAGYGGYGGWRRGVRIVRMGGFDGGGGLGMDVDTWVRMQGGEVVMRVRLNETYGVDVYPVADGE